MPPSAEMKSEIPKLNVAFDLRQAIGPIQRGHLKMGGSDDRGHRIEVNSYYLEKNGRPWLPIMGEFHFSRYPDVDWPRELMKIKAGGVEIVSTYLFWNHHEEEEGVFDFSGNRDIRRFVELCQQHGLLVALRIGPFGHGEVRNGGLPDWLYAKPFEGRSNDRRYLDLVRRLYGQIGRHLKDLMYRNGGPVIMVQLENEYADSVAPWETTPLPAMEFSPKGSGGVEHMRILRRLAMEAGLDVPLFAATAWGSSPVLAEELLPLFGGYAFHAWREEPTPQPPTECYLFKDAHHRPTRTCFDPSMVPYACCEMGGGMQSFYKQRPVVPAASVEAMQVVYLGSGTNLPGFYMYHGGSNPVGKYSFLNEHRCPRISYDFQAPIGEFGELRESYHRLRRQFLFLRHWGELLAPMATSLPERQAPITAGDARSPRCAIRSKDGRGFVFFSNYQDHVEMQSVGPFGVRIRLAQGDELKMPVQGGLELEPGVCGIFPFHLDLDGIDLAYATAQPMARLPVGGATHYFFYSPRGITPEYVFAAATVKHVKLQAPGPSPTANAGGLIPVIVKAGLDSLIELTNRTGQRILITTLTDGESLRFWQGRLWGAERIVMTDADILFHDDGLELQATDQTVADVRVYPDPGTFLKSPTDEIIGQMDGLYRHYRVPLPPGNPDCQVEIVAPDRAVVHVGPGAFEDFDEVLLRIDYEGDVGTAWVGGRLIHDNFNDDTPWRIGLRRFIRAGMAVDVGIKIVPRGAMGGRSKIQNSEMAAIRLAEDTCAVARIKSVTAMGLRHVSLTQLRAAAPTDEYGTPCRTCETLGK